MEYLTMAKLAIFIVATHVLKKYGENRINAPYAMLKLNL